MPNTKTELTKKRACDLAKGDRWAPMHSTAYTVTNVRRGRDAYAGWMVVQYAQPEVPGGVAQQHVRAMDEVSVELTVVPLAEAGYVVEPLSGADAWGNPWQYRVTGPRGGVWYIKLMVVNAPTPFLDVSKGTDRFSDGGLAIGKFGKVVVREGVLCGVQK